MLFFFIASALSQVPIDEIEIVADPIKQAYEWFDQSLKTHGYGKPLQRDGYLLYRHNTDLWRPSLRLYQSGFVQIKRGPVRTGGAADPGSKQLCLGVPFATQKQKKDGSGPKMTPSVFNSYCIKFDGLLVNKRILTSSKTEMSEWVHPELLKLRSALEAESFRQRLTIQLPAELKRLWTDGEPIDGDGPPLQTMIERRGALLSFWSTRLSNERGQAVRSHVEDFVLDVVQKSDAPFTPSELRQAEATLGFVLPR